MSQSAFLLLPGQGTLISRPRTPHTLHLPPRHPVSVVCSTRVNIRVDRLTVSPQTLIIWQGVIPCSPTLHPHDALTLPATTTALPRLLTSTQTEAAPLNPAAKNFFLYFLINKSRLHEPGSVFHRSFLVVFHFIYIQIYVVSGVT